MPTTPLNFVSGDIATNSSSVPVPAAGETFGSNVTKKSNHTAAALSSTFNFSQEEHLQLVGAKNRECLLLFKVFDLLFKDVADYNVCSRSDSDVMPTPKRVKTGYQFASFTS